ncbi:Re/Si-specific NAD(P)(+) transhydrogenase subunit alpha [Oceanomicrobium pacificus]|uniref:proton-translocating NAD(P)(+) transhydrogenase n=1 Tax=Oceanomicrobium pacificus TaxID=2692916 RepID=A0A6B0TZH1_9RHOB|nr:Re/Si-specific NAD(P)(+) transhydrogenase subunit alpha [Oceanomicrobium pacificus]MXU66808.1 Re/Si-specific NAD(P)(+) transhydrogenase subunit alpha [Oceanomicrobium pacificus]
MKIAIPKETRADETRVAAVPETVKKFLKLGAEVTVQAGAGASASIPDAAFEDAGATIAKTYAATLKGADVVLKVLAPTEAEVKSLAKGQKLFAIMAPYGDPEIMQACADKGVDAFAMEFMPRISRAQSMDVLSSQSNLAGYKAVIEAANSYGKAMPQMMTAAGTVAPAKVFVMGVGVAGLQAIATARRLGAIVTATDVRPATEEQVASLGAKFIAVKNEEFEQAQTSGGYAKEMSDDYKRQQADLVAGHIAKQDIVITTALIPGRKAPELVSADMVASMKPGSVLVDLAIEQGGNVAGAKLGETVTTDNGVSIIGYPNMAGRLAADASALFARNHYNFLAQFFGEEGFAFDPEDELVKGIQLTGGGAVIHPNFAEKEAE